MGAFRRGTFVGFAMGYVMGSKAGRDRYEQINRVWKKVKVSGPYQEMSDKVGAAVGLGLERGKLVMLDRMVRKARTPSARAFPDENHRSHLSDL